MGLFTRRKKSYEEQQAELEAKKEAQDERLRSKIARKEAEREERLRRARERGTRAATPRRERVTAGVKRTSVAVGRGIFTVAKEAARGYDRPVKKKYLDITRPPKMKGTKKRRKKMKLQPKPKREGLIIGKGLMGKEVEDFFSDW